MELLTQLITNYIDDKAAAGQWAMWLIAGAVFFTVLGLLFLANTYFDPVRARFLRTKDPNYIPSGDISNEYNEYLKYQHILLPSDEKLIGRTTQRLHHAGFHYRKHLFQYFTIRLACTIAFPIVALFVVAMLPSATANTYFQSITIAAAVGFVGPSFVLDRLVKNRQKTIQRAFPDALDLLVVCSEAGLSLDAALQKVAAEINFSQPILAQELSLMIAEIRAGVDRKKAFSSFAERVGIDEIRSLMSSINQSMRFGSSIADTLRVYSEDFRDKRMQAAEEKAAKIGAKLIFPIAVCLLPCFIMIVLVPFALTLAKTFQNL